MVEDTFSYKLSCEYNSVEIHKGIHCYSLSSISFISSYENRFGPIKDLYSLYLKCLIPAGIPYIEGEKNDIASLVLVIPPVDEKSVFIIDF